MTACKYGDPLCPCQDGDMCHYEGPNPMSPPAQGIVSREASETGTGSTRQGQSPVGD